MLTHAQDLVYNLSELMPTQYQKYHLSAMLGLLLEAQGHPLPENSQTRSQTYIKPVFKYKSLVNKGSGFALFATTYLNKFYLSFHS